MCFVHRSSLLLGILMILAASPALATETPGKVKLVTAPEARMMVRNSKALLIHVLSKIEFKIQHIPASINIPVDEVETSDKMPKAKDQPIIFYCNGVACPYSKRAALKAVEMGYAQVYWFRGGIMEWRKFQYDMYINKELSRINVPKLRPEKFQESLRSNVLVLDVRPKWWRHSKELSGVIEGTTLMIPLLDLDNSLDLIAKDRPILLVDRLMRQSIHAAKFLKNNGYNVLGVLKGGTRRWVSEGRPVLESHLEPAPAAGL